MRWILEKAMAYGKTVFMCFIDYNKAFDCVDHSRLWNTLRKMGVPEHLTVLIESMYTKQKAAVRKEYGNMEWFEVRKGVRQGCILSPYLFNLYSECNMRRVGLEDEKGIKVGGRTMNNLRYAEDTTILAEDKKDLEKILKKLKEESEKVGMMLNLKKTKILTTRTPKQIHIGRNGDTDNKLLHIYGHYNHQRWLHVQRNQWKTFKWKNGNDKTRKNYEGSGRDSSNQS
jgi:hypothetical protein